MGSWGAPCQGDAVAPDGQAGLGSQHLPRQPVGLLGIHGARPGGDHRRVVPDPPSDNGRDGLRPVAVRRLQGHLPPAPRLHLRPPPSTTPPWPSPSPPPPPPSSPPSS